MSSSSNPKRTLGDRVYDASASFGTLYTTVSSALLVLAGVGLLIAGVYTLYTSITTAKRVSVQGKVEVVQPCTVTLNKRTSTTKCPIRVWYAVNGTPYTYNTVVNRQYMAGDAFTLYIDPNVDPSAAFETDGKDYTASAMMLVGGLVCFAIAYVTQRAVSESKGLAAYMGVNALL